MSTIDTSLITQGLTGLPSVGEITAQIAAAKVDILALEGGSISTTAADLTALKAIAAVNRTNGMLVMLRSDGSTWRFHSTSTAADTSENLVATPGAGSGRWLRNDKVVALSLACDFGTADNATLFTVPVGARLRPHAAWWEVSVSWTGGTASAIGVHASPTGWSTKGDILGGATGDVEATLVSTDTRMTGTVGATLDGSASGTKRLILIAADTLKFDRITSVFTAGAANVRVLCDVLANPGALRHAQARHCHAGGHLLRDGDPRGQRRGPLCGLHLFDRHDRFPRDPH